MTKHKTITPDVVVSTREGEKDAKIRLSLPKGVSETIRVPGTGDVPIADVVQGLYGGHYDLTAQIKMKDQTERLKKRIKDLEKELGENLTYQEIREHIFGLAAQNVEMPDWDFKYDLEPGFPGVPIAVLSDLHYGESVSLKEMGGTNQYSVDIADERIRTWTRKLVSMCFEHEAWKGKYPGLVLCLGGDMISGDIHDELKESNDLPTLETVMRLSGALKRSILELAEHFDNIAIPCVTGNHGRMTHKPHAKGYNEVNFETLLYLMLERELKDDPRIKFIFPNDTVVHFSVYGTNYALTHGNLLGVKGGDGIIGAIGPITRGVIKLMNSEASKPNPHRIDRVIMGHWHTAMQLPQAFVNGSLKGYDEYARTFLRTRFERPGQILWRTHPQHGPVRFETIYADEDMQRLTKPKPKQAWFSSDAAQNGHWSTIDVEQPLKGKAPKSKRPPANGNAPAASRKRPEAA